MGRGRRTKTNGKQAAPRPAKTGRVDPLTPEKRSDTMSRVKATNTKPEVRVRSALHRLGYRFRLHRKDLPGTPDVVLPKRRTVVFVHGCFWHQHPGCRKATIPKNNADYWGPKLRRNVMRDEAAGAALGELGWRVLTLWECEIPRDEAALREKLREDLESAPR